MYDSSNDEVVNTCRERSVPGPLRHDELWRLNPQS